MADYFTSASVELELPSKEAVDHAIDLAQAMSDVCACIEPEAEIIPEGWAADAEDENWNFDVEKEEGNKIWIHSDSGGIDEIIKLIQHLMRKFDMTEPVSFEWSHTCSKPRTDAYGGGAAYITATEVRTFNTSQWLRAQGISATTSQSQS